MFLHLIRVSNKYLSQFHLNVFLQYHFYSMLQTLRRIYFWRIFYLDLKWCHCIFARTYSNWKDSKTIYRIDGFQTL